ncbi:MAG: glycosyltransferase family 2 protein [Firmicutes bacterium]|nr:glycosyltransferase family 2 protein [Bacillota bacterium]
MIVPCYNRASYIRACLASISKQSYSNWELIVVDDASTDNTVKEVKRFIQSLPPHKEARVRLVTRLTNGGYARALSDGLAMSRGEYVALQDSDDLSHVDRIRRQVAYLRAHPTIGIVGTRYRVLSAGRIDPLQKPTWLVHGVRAIRAVYRNGGHCICVGTMMVRGCHIDQFGGPTSRIQGAEDYEFVARMIGAGVLAENLRAELYDYRSHPEQRSRRFYK